MNKYPHKLTLILFILIFGKSISAQDYLVKSTFLGSRSQFDLLLLFGQPVDYGVDLYKITYKTPGIDMLPDTASGLLVVPQVPDSARLPIVVYEHGTTDGPTDVPSQLRGGFEVALGYGGYGFITIAPDYLGLGDSRGFHTYVHAGNEASASLDALNAGLEWLDFNNPDWDPYFLFLAGYSQGGHASMALHKEIEDFWSFVYPVTAATHMSGPYSMSGVMRDLFLGDVSYGSPAYFAYTILGYNQVYNLYTDLNEVFKPPYATSIQNFYNGSINLTTLNQQLIAQLAAGGDTIVKRMIQDTILAGMIADPNNRFNLALKDNDVYEWAPSAPTRLYYCGADEQVPIANTTLAATTMQGLGATDVQAIDLNPNYGHSQCVFPAILNSIEFFLSFVHASAVQNVDLASDELHPFPNPTSDFISFDWTPARGGFDYQVFNSNGMSVEKGTTSSSHLSLSKLPGGLYMILCTAGGQTKMGRVLKQ